MDIISHVNQTKKSVVIVSIDFEKCFDRIEHESIFAAMHYFNFGERFIEWTKIFFTDFLICTLNGGFNSDFFVKERGVNQGCNISPGCYVICREIMAHLIKHNGKIKGKNGLTK